MLKIMSNEYQDKNEKYETDLIELTDRNFISDWYSNSQEQIGERNFEVFECSNH